MITQRDRIRQGGTVLVVLAVFQGIMAAAMGFYFYRQSNFSATTARVNEGQSNAQSAAEFATELTIANLIDVEYKETDDGEKVSISSDWVGSDPYHSIGDKQFMRVISGTVGDYNYQVQVVPVREMRDHIKNGGSTDYPKDWMTNVPVEPYSYDVDPIRKFSAAYEITATANNRFGGDTAGRGVSQMIVGLEYQSAYNEQDKAATLHLNKPSGLVDDTILVSAEDHYSIKTVAKSGIIDEVIHGMVPIQSLATELNSVNNSWWNWGRQTLHFQLGDDPNPNRPRTIYFGTGIHQKMIKLDPDRDPDQYITGGKFDPSNDYRTRKLYANSGWDLLYRWGRGITLDEDGDINETVASDALPDKKLTREIIAIGDPRDLSKLYFLEVDPSSTASTSGAYQHTNWPADNLEDDDPAVREWIKDYWRTIPFSSHPKAITKNTGTKMTWIRPLDNKFSPYRRHFPAMMMLLNEEGALLVREYDDGIYSSPTNGESGMPPDDWRGTYAWMFKFGYTSGNTSKTSTQAPINVDGDNTVFYHGGWLKPDATNTTKGPKNFPKIMNPRLFSLLELYGIQMEVDQDGIPCKLDENGAIEAGIPDIIYDSYGNEIPYDPHGYGTQFDEEYQRLDREDNWGITEESKKFWPPADGIYVRLPNDAKEWDWIAPEYGDGVVRKYKKHQSLKDFAYQRNITGDEDNPDFRDVVGVYLSFDSTPEKSKSGAGWYFDYEMVFSVMYPKTVEVATDNLDDIFRQWWQGNHQEGLTGNMGHTALSNYPVEPTGEQEDYFDSALAAMPVIENEESEVPGINVVVDSSGQISGFSRADFLLGDEAGTLSDTAKNSSDGSGVYYYGDDDLWELAVWLYENGKIDAYLKNHEEDLQAFLDEGDIAGYNDEWARLIQEFAFALAESQNPGITFRHLNDRFNEESHLEQLVFNIENAGTLLDPAAPVTTRSFVEMAFGGRSDPLPAAYVERNSSTGTISPIQDDSLRNLADGPHTHYSVSFTPGEFQFDSSERTTIKGAGWVDIAYNEATRYTAVQPNGMPIEAKFIWLDTSPYGQVNMTTIHDHPDWFSEYVDELYKRYPFEHRGALGWHREGPGEEPFSTLNDKEKRQRLMYGDHYEFVILSSLEAGNGFFPYQTLEVGGNQYLALFNPYEELNDDEQDYSDYMPRLKPTSEMPTFVIDGEELDGSGILVVNGNLHVKTRFAFHGTLVVMGDIVVTPQRYGIYDRSGNRYDLEGNAYWWNAHDSMWHPVDTDSELEPINILPEEWLGELIVQGKVMVGGAVITNNPIETQDVRGIVDIRSSTKAIEDTTGTWIKVGPNEKFSASRLVWSNAEPRLDD